MHSRVLITLFSIALSILVAACTPQNVKRDAPPDVASDRAQPGKEPQKAVSTETTAREPTPPPPTYPSREVEKKSKTQSYKREPSTAPAKPKTSTKAETKPSVAARPKPTVDQAAKPKPVPLAREPEKPKPEAADKPVQKPEQPVVATTPSDAPRETEQATESAREESAKAQQEPLQTTRATQDGREQASMAPSPEPKPEAVTAQDEVASDSELEAPQDLVDDSQSVAMLTEKSALAEETPVQLPAKEETPLDLSALPLEFGALWSLDRRPTPVSDQAHCLLASRSINISDGYDRTDVQLLLTAHSLYVKTNSNIDLSYPDTGVRLDDGSLVPFDGVAQENIAIIKTDVTALYQRMLPSQTAVVRLGFWPTWPVTETQEARFPLRNLDDAVEALWLCEKM